MSKDPELFNKLIQWLEGEYENYEYTRDDFILVQEDNGVTIKNWNLEVKLPDYIVIESIKLVPKIIKNSIEDIIRRLELLENK